MSKRRGCLVDTTRCIGCRSCQVACKQSNGLEFEKTRFFAGEGGYQNPRGFSPRTYTYISYHELQRADGEPGLVCVKHQCMHCGKLYCARVCPGDVFEKTATGVVDYKPDECIGCGQCIDACPFRVPRIDYFNVGTPHLRKCTFCLGRQETEIEEGSAEGPSAARRRSFQTPACAKACPTGTLKYGDREELLAEAKRRIAADPERYLDHVYGETEVGGTAWLYLSAVPFEEVGLPIEFLDLEMFEKVHLG